MLKLGAANLRWVPALDNDIDRRIVGTLAARSLRLRLEQVARLLAEGMVQTLEQSSGAPLHVLDIAGGPALDAINALLLIDAAQPALLRARQVIVHALDIDASGPAFGKSALAALQGEGGRLAGVSVELVHTPWDWRDLPALALLLGDLEGRGAVIAATSEGGLFEYGSDGEIEGVLRTLAAGTGSAAIVTGSVTRDDPPTRLFTRRSLFPIVPRGGTRFAQLAAASGWALSEIRPAAFSEQVLLRKP